MTLTPISFYLFVNHKVFPCMELYVFFWSIGGYSTFLSAHWTTIYYLWVSSFLFSIKKRVSVLYKNSIKPSSNHCHFENFLLYQITRSDTSSLFFSSLNLFLIVTSVTPEARAISVCVLFSPVLRQDK